MRVRSSSIYIFPYLLLCGCAVAKSPDGPRKPAELPLRYRDFKVYTTSAPDTANPNHIVMTVQFHNEGKKTLSGHATLQPQTAAGLKGGEFPFKLAAAGEADWKVDLYPPDGLKYQVVNGAIYFGKVHGRDLFIAVQGPDPADFSRKGVQKINAKAEAVGTYAPLSSIDWWRSDPDVSQPPHGKRIVLAAAGQSKYRIVLTPMPRNADGSEMTVEAWKKLDKPRPGERELALAVGDLQYCLQKISGATLPVTNSNGHIGPAINLVLTTTRPPSGTNARTATVPWPYADSYDINTMSNGDVVITSGHLDGLRQGIYGLLTDHLDCHWFMPNKLGEEIPQPADRTAVIGEIHEQQNPSFFSANSRWDRARLPAHRGR